MILGHCNMNGIFPPNEKQTVAGAYSAATFTGSGDGGLQRMKHVVRGWLPDLDQECQT